MPLRTRRITGFVAASLLGVGLAVSGTGPASALPSARLVPVPKNVNISRSSGNQSESAIAIQKTNTLNVTNTNNVEAGSGLFHGWSTDGGATWQTPISIPNSPQWGTLDVASNGNLFIGGGDSGSSFWCIRSTNAQNPAVTPTFDQVTTVNMGGSLWYGPPVNPDGLAGQIFLVVDRSGGPTNNNIYMMASVRPTGFSTGTDVMFAGAPMAD